MKNIHIVNKMVAQNLGIDLKIVEKVNKSYWKAISKALTTVDEQAVHIKKIGTIEASGYKTRAYIFYLIKKIRKVEASPKYTEETKVKMIASIKDSIRKLLKKRNQLAIEYNTNREKRKEKFQLKYGQANRVPETASTSVGE